MGGDKTRAESLGSAVRTAAFTKAGEGTEVGGFSFVFVLKMPSSSSDRTKSCTAGERRGEVLLHSLLCTALFLGSVFPVYCAISL